MKLFKSAIQLFLLLAVAVVAVSCDGKGDDPNPDTKPTPRTVLVYMLANNSLGDSGFDYKDIKEMEAAVDDLGRSRWIVYHEHNDGSIELKELRKSGWIVLKTYSNDVESTTSQRMSEVIRDTKAMAPAENYGIVLWSHASGWVVDGEEDRKPITSNEIMPLSFGDDRGGRMNIATLRRVLENEDFDYIYTDCCNMATIEVVYELRDVAQYFVGSALELPADGMPYDRNLKLLAAEDVDIIGAARNTYDYYFERGRSGDWCAISVVDLEEVEDLAMMTAAIYNTVPNYDASYVPQRFDIRNPCRFYDFKHFVDYLTLGTEMGDAWNRQLEKVVLYQASMPKFENLNILYHCGLATNILTSSNPVTLYGYNETEWYKDVAIYQPKVKS